MQSAGTLQGNHEAAVVEDLQPRRKDRGSRAGGLRGWVPGPEAIAHSIGCAAPACSVSATLLPL
jgi:hypothetical protein